MVSSPDTGALQRSLTKVNSYPKWIVFNAASLVVVTFCMLIAGPTFVRVARPANVADASIKLVNNTLETYMKEIDNDVHDVMLPPTEDATPEGRIKVILHYAPCMLAPCCELYQKVPLESLQHSRLACLHPAPTWCGQHLGQRCLLHPCLSARSGGWPELNTSWLQAPNAMA
jgi:hypothetical protein